MAIKVCGGREDADADGGFATGPGLQRPARAEVVIPQSKTRTWVAPSRGHAGSVGVVAQHRQFAAVLDPDQDVHDPQVSAARTAAGSILRTSLKPSHSGVPVSGSGYRWSGPFLADQVRQLSLQAVGNQGDRPSNSLVRPRGGQVHTCTDCPGGLVLVREHISQPVVDCLAKRSPRGSHSTGRIWPQGTDVICSPCTICGLQLLEAAKFSRHELADWAVPVIEGRGERHVRTVVQADDILAPVLFRGVCDRFVGKPDHLRDAPLQAVRV